MSGRAPPPMSRADVPITLGSWRSSPFPPYPLPSVNLAGGARPSRFQPPIKTPSLPHVTFRALPPRP
ncbi:hypothetical protein NL676_031505 [Syzygium grande]|nr:hypothetical protein NL676_031505 [Syzygium grande]